MIRKQKRKPKELFNEKLLKLNEEIKRRVGYLLLCKKQKIS